MATISIDPYPMPGSAGAPAASAPWRFEPHRAALLIHDMQRYFVGFYPDGEPRTSLVANVVALRDAARHNGMPVFYTAQPGSMSDADRGLLADVWGPGMSAEPRHRDIIDELAPGPSDTVLTKWRYSAFFRTGLLDALRAGGRDQLVVCGVYAHVGCLATALDAFTHDIETFLVADAVADFGPDEHAMALTLAARTCAGTPTRAELLAGIGQEVPA